MTSSSDDRDNPTFAHTRAEGVTKPDGRYLVYYSWPGLDDDEMDPARDAEEPRGASQERGPDQQPWSPQAGPPDE